MKIKKLLAVLTALTMAASFAACSGNDETQGEAEKTTAFAEKAENDSKQETTKTEKETEKETEAETTTEETTTTEAETEPPLEVVEPAAEEFEYNYDAALKGAVITAYNGEAEAIRIPAELDGDPVASVSLRGNNYVKKVELPDGITAIGEDAFSNCSNLISINIPDSVTEIGQDAFRSCSSLEKIEVPAGVEVLDGTFSSCTSLKEVILHDGLKIIGGTYWDYESNNGYGDYVYFNSAFECCYSLESIEIPKSVNIIGENAFRASGLKNITIPENVSYCGAYVFSECSDLTDATFECKELKGGSGLFDSCSNLVNVNFNGGENVFYGMFVGCTSLEKITLVDGMNIIGNKAFAGCTNLKEVNIPDSLKYIGEGGLQNCTSLRELNLPDNFAYLLQESIYKNEFNAASAFYGCDGLTVTYKGKEYNYSNWDELTQAVKDSGIECTVE